MNDSKKIVIVLFKLLGWWPAFSWVTRMDEWKSKTDTELVVSIIQAFTGADLDDIFCQDFNSLSCSEFREGEFRAFISDLLFEVEFSSQN